MPIQSFWVENYKAFASRADIEVRPLTLLFGHNSVGKSALLRLLPLLADSATSYTARSATAEPLALGSDAARGANFNDLKCQLSDASSISFGIKWSTGPAVAGKAIPNGVTFSIRDLQDRRRHFVEQLAIHYAEESSISATWLLPPRQPRGKRAFPRQHLPSRYAFSSSISKAPLEGLLYFRGLLPDIGRLSLDIPFRDEIVRSESMLRRYLTRVQWLKALRALAPRYEVLEGARQISSDGSGTTQFLASDSAEGGNITALVSDWYEKATGHRLEVKLGAFSGREMFSLCLFPRGGATKGIDLVDVGEGMGQVLPVLTLLALAKVKRIGAFGTILIEHPELHLHPGAHGPLAEMFCDVSMGAGAPRLIVETHSENFLLRVQLAIATGQLDPKRVVVYWVRQSDSGQASADRIEFDELGQPAGDAWPPGVFSENVEQARQIMLARRRRKQA